MRMTIDDYDYDDNDDKMNQNMKYNNSYCYSDI